MANDLIITEELSYLAEFSFDNDFADAMGSGFIQPDAISIAGNRFATRQGDIETNLPDPLRMHFVVLGVKKPPTYTYYDSPYDGDEPGPPVWMSHDGVFLDSGTLPEGIKSVADHPAMQWGSAVSKKSGRPIMAARQHKHVVIKVMGLDGMWLLKIPPASINKYWSPLVQQIKEISDKEKAKHGKATLSMATCVIEATFLSGTNGVLQFTPKGYLQGEEVAKVAALHKDREAIEKMLWGPEGSVRKAKWEETIGKVAVAAELPASTPIIWEANGVQAPVNTTTPQPAPKAAKGKAKVAPKTDVSSILQSMGLAE